MTNLNEIVAIAKGLTKDSDILPWLINSDVTRNWRYAILFLIKIYRWLWIKDLLCSVIKIIKVDFKDRRDTRSRDAELSIKVAPTVLPSTVMLIFEDSFLFVHISFSIKDTKEL